MDAKTFVEQVEKEADSFCQLFDAYRIGNYLVLTWEITDHYSIHPHTEIYILKEGNWVLTDPEVDDLEVIV